MCKFKTIQLDLCQHAKHLNKLENQNSKISVVYICLVFEKTVRNLLLVMVSAPVSAFNLSNSSGLAVGFTPQTFSSCFSLTQNHNGPTVRSMNISMY